MKKVFEKINTRDMSANELWKDYAVTYNGGLRKKSKRLLADFVEYISKVEDITRDEFVELCCESIYDEQNDFDLQFPVVSRIILPVCIKKSRAGSAKHMRWLSSVPYLNKEISKSIYEEFGDTVTLLFQSHNIDKGNFYTVTRIIDSRLYGLYYGSHHFPDFILIERSEVEQFIDEIVSVLTYLDNDVKSQYIDSLKYYKELYDDWFECLDSDDDVSFLDWCKNNNREYSWVKSYYY